MSIYKLMTIELYITYQREAEARYYSTVRVVQH